MSESPTETCSRLGKPSRTQSPGEEIANSVSHGIGLLAALAGAPFLIASATREQNTAMIIGCGIFSAAMILMYLASTLYHALPHGRGKRVLRVLDHTTIFLLIAGTYTPIALGVLEGALGWGILGAIWLLALCGIFLKISGNIKHPKLSIVLYMVMGWLVVVAIQPLWLRMPVAGLVWLVGGGLAYTLGTAFYANDARMKYGHFIWHLFVLTGTGCHFAAILASV